MELQRGGDDKYGAKKYMPDSFWSPRTVDYVLYALLSFVLPCAAKPVLAKLK